MTENLEMQQKSKIGCRSHAATLNYKANRITESPRQYGNDQELKRPEQISTLLKRNNVRNERRRSRPQKS